eukprot:744653-Rhodomonas_salina.8
MMRPLLQLPCALLCPRHPPLHLLHRQHSVTRPGLRQLLSRLHARVPRFLELLILQRIARLCQPLLAKPPEHRELHLLHQLSCRFLAFPVVHNTRSAFRLFAQARSLLELPSFQRTPRLPQQPLAILEPLPPSLRLRHALLHRLHLCSQLAWILSHLLHLDSPVIHRLPRFPNGLPPPHLLAHAQRALSASQCLPNLLVQCKLPLLALDPLLQPHELLLALSCDSSVLEVRARSLYQPLRVLVSPISQRVLRIRERVFSLSSPSCHASPDGERVAG